jgi:hypothetical protein
MVNNGTITGATYTTGKLGNYALDFTDGNTVVITDHATLDLTQISVTFWAKFTATNLDLIRKWETAGNQRSWAIYTDASQKLTFSTSFDGTASASSVSTTSVNSGSWIHIAVTFDGSTRKVYINGTEEDSDSASGSIFVSTSDIKFGDSLLTSNNYVGQIDDVRIFNKGLSAIEVSKIYRGLKVLDGLVAKYDLEEGSGAVAYDTGALSTVTVSTNGGFKTFSSSKANLYVAIIEVIESLENNNLLGEKVTFNTQYDTGNSVYVVTAYVPTGSGVPNA